MHRAVAHGVWTIWVFPGGFQFGRWTRDLFHRKLPTTHFPNFLSISLIRPSISLISELGPLNWFFFIVIIKRKQHPWSWTLVIDEDFVLLELWKFKKKWRWERFDMEGLIIHEMIYHWYMFFSVFSIQNRRLFKGLEMVKISWLWDFYIQSHLLMNIAYLAVPTYSVQGL